MDYAEKKHSTTRTYITKLVLAGLTILFPFLCGVAQALTWSPPQTLVGPLSGWRGSPFLAFDSNNVWHMVYGRGEPVADEYINYITYMNSEGGSYDVVQGISPDYVGDPSIASDLDGNLHMVYRNTLGSIMYTNNVSGYWSPPQTLVGPLSGWRGSPSLAFDSNNVWHMVYGRGEPVADEYINYITYMNSEGDSYDVVQGITPDYVGDPSIASDLDGNLHMVYRSTLGSIMYTTSEYKTYVLAVGVNWGGGLRGDLDAGNLAAILKAALPSCVDNPVILCLNPSISNGSNLTSVRNAVVNLINQVEPGDGLILYFASHGEAAVSGTEVPFWTNLWPHPDGYGHGPMEWRTGDEYVCLADEDDPNDNSDRLYDDVLRNLLADGRLTSVRKIVIFDSCRSGGFGPDLGTSIYGTQIPNIAVLAGCNEGYFTFSSPYGTGVVTNCILDGLSKSPSGYMRADGADGSKPNGTVTLNELYTYIKEACDVGVLIGQELPLRYLKGTGIFTGVEPNFVASDEFAGVFQGRMPGDIDSDRRVDMKDFALLAGKWLATDCAATNDCNGTDLAPPDAPDGTVDILDLALLATNWIEVVSR